MFFDTVFQTTRKRKSFKTNRCILFLVNDPEINEKTSKCTQGPEILQGHIFFSCLSFRSNNCTQ
jgi:hypothetical protein